MDDSIEYLVNDHKEIESLKLAYSAYLPEEFLRHIPGLKNLKKLHIVGSLNEMFTKKLHTVGCLHEMTATGKGLASQLQELSIRSSSRWINGLISNTLSAVNGENLALLDLSFETGGVYSRPAVFGADFPTTFPRLKVLRLKKLRMTCANLVKLLNKVGQQLEELHLENSLIVGMSDQLSNSFSRLRVLKLINSRWSPVLILLAQMCGDNLELLDLRGTIVKPTHITNYLPSLTQLRISEDDGLPCLLGQISRDLVHLDVRLLGSPSLDCIDRLADDNVPFPKLKVLRAICRDDGKLNLLKLVGKDLEVLDLSGITVIRENREGFAFPKLRILRLRKCLSITDECLADLLSMIGKDLEFLDLSKTDLLLNNLNESWRFPNLRILRLHECKNIDDKCLADLLAMIGKDLEFLDLSETDLLLNNLNETRFPKLQTLLLYNCKNITDECLVDLLGRIGPDLDHLDLSYTCVTLESLHSLTNSFPILRVLRLNNCTLLTDTGLVNIMKQLGDALEELRLSSTYVNLGAVNQICVDLSRLRRLDVADAINITTATIIHFLGKIGHDNLNSEDNDKMTKLKRNVSELKRKFPESCRIIHCENLFHLDITRSNLEEDAIKAHFSGIHIFCEKYSPREFDCFLEFEFELEEEF